MFAIALHNGRLTRWANSLWTHNVTSHSKSTNPWVNVVSHSKSTNPGVRLAEQHTPCESSLHVVLAVRDLEIRANRTALQASIAVAWWLETGLLYLTSWIWHMTRVVSVSTRCALMSMFANNALLGGGVRVRAWIREQRKIKRRSEALLCLWWQTWTSLSLCVVPCVSINIQCVSFHSHTARVVLLV